VPDEDDVVEDVVPAPVDGDALPVPLGVGVVSCVVLVGVGASGGASATDPRAGITGRLCAWPVTGSRTAVPALACPPPTERPTSTPIAAPAREAAAITATVLGEVDRSDQEAMPEGLFQ
jgi:hypothetical protein